MRRHLISLVLALTVTTLTIFYQRLGTELVAYEGVEPGWSYTRVIVAGWPLPFIYDKPGLSVANSVAWSGAMLGEDQFRPWPFLGNVAIYFVVFWLIRIVVRSAHRSR
jgi:hypothetical protein